MGSSDHIRHFSNWCDIYIRWQNQFAETSQTIIVTGQIHACLQHTHTIIYFIIFSTGQTKSMLCFFWTDFPSMCWYKPVKYRKLPVNMNTGEASAVFPGEMLSGGGRVPKEWVLWQSFEFYGEGWMIELGEVAVIVVKPWQNDRIRWGDNCGSQAVRGSNKSLGCIFSEKPADWTNAFNLKISSLTYAKWHLNINSGLVTDII